MGKVYARQISPEYQESPISFAGCFPEGIVLDGNRDYISRTVPEYENILRFFDDMAGDWENDNFHYEWNGTGYIKHKKRAERTIEELLSLYGFEKANGRAWSTKEKHEWKMLMQSGKAADSDDVIKKAMHLLTGHQWCKDMIRGCCQSDWQEVYYDTEYWSRQDLKVFEVEYFNMGTEWIIHDEIEEPECAEDIRGFSAYCISWGNDGIRKELADIAGVEVSDMVLFAHDGYTKIPKYKMI